MPFNWAGGLAALLLALASLLYGCSRQNDDEGREFVRHLDAEVKALAVGQTIAMAKVNTRDWDGLLVFPPYTPAETMDRIVGQQGFFDRHGQRLKERDDVQLFVFRGKGAIQMVVAVPRSVFNLAGWEAGKLVSRDEAVFEKQAGVVFRLR